MVVHASDAELVSRCRAGERAAWDALVERFSRYVYAIAVQGFRLPAQEAEDVFQEVFARVYEHFDRLRDDGALRPWIGQITRRLCFDRVHAVRRESPVGADYDETRTDEMLAELETAMSVRAALEELGDPCREILERFFCRDESYRTIAKELELPPGTIASRISRCLGKLRSELVGRELMGGAS